MSVYYAGFLATFVYIHLEAVRFRKGLNPVSVAFFSMWWPVSMPIYLIWLWRTKGGRG